MKGFWKWFWIVIGVLALIAVSFAIALFFFRGGARVGVRTFGPGMMIGHSGLLGGMMFGMGLMMLFRALIPLGILVLAGFGIAYLVRSGRQPAAMPAVANCAACGKPLAAEWTTCPYCGTKVEPPTAPVSPQA
jgi:Predicted membrane protein